nr:hypothetical protein [Tanacetum cinerariifolium]
MRDENHIRTLGDYSKPSHEGYRNTIELLAGNSVVPLQFHTIRLVQNGCSFHGLWFEDLNQHLKDFLKLVDSLDLDSENRERTRRTAKLRNDILMFQQHHGESLSEAWTRFKDLLQKVPHRGIDPHTERMKRFENAVFKQHEGINSRMTEMFGLLKELTTSKTPEKVLIIKEAKFPVTKNMNSISLIKREEERSNKKEVTPKNAERPTETKAEIPVKKAETKNEAKNRAGNKSIKTPKNEEAVEAPGSEPVAYYLKHKINEKQIEGLVDNNRFNNSLSGTRVGKKKGKTYKVLPRGPIYDAILKKKITKKEDIEGNFKIPCNVGGQKGINALVDQGSDLKVMPYTTYIKLTYMKLTDEVSFYTLFRESPRTEERVKTKYRGKNSDQPTSTAFLGWILFTGGASNTEGSRADVVLTNPNEHKITYALHINFKTSNNEAKYKALLAGLELAIRMEARHLQVFSDTHHKSDSCFSFQRERKWQQLDCGVRHFRMTKRGCDFVEETEVVMWVLPSVSPARGVRRFGIKGKLSPRFIGPFEILDRVGEVSYRLALPPQLSHVHDVFHVSLLRGYKYHPLHVITYPLDQIRTDLSYEEEPKAIIDRQDRIMRKKTISFVKILWRNHPEREATWETEESIRTSYPHFLP